MAQHLLIYAYVEGMAHKRGPHRNAHLAHIAAMRQDGRITHAGAFDPPAGGAIVFDGVELGDVEAFVADDPYTAAGLISHSRIERWNLL